jgi:hypothetical protein
MANVFVVQELKCDDAGTALRGFRYRTETGDEWVGISHPYNGVLLNASTYQQSTSGVLTKEADSERACIAALVAAFRFTAHFHSLQEPLREAYLLGGEHATSQMLDLFRRQSPLPPPGTWADLVRGFINPSIGPTRWGEIEMRAHAGGFGAVTDDGYIMVTPEVYSALAGAPAPGADWSEADEAAVSNFMMSLSRRGLSAKRPAESKPAVRAPIQLTLSSSTRISGGSDFDPDFFDDPSPERAPPQSEHSAQERRDNELGLPVKPHGDVKDVRRPGAFEAARTKLHVGPPIETLTAYVVRVFAKLLSWLVVTLLAPVFIFRHRHEPGFWRYTIQVIGRTCVDTMLLPAMPLVLFERFVQDSSRAGRRKRSFSRVDR